MMEVLLCEDVQGLGKSGQIVKVKDGFARNFLLPQKKGCPATPENKKRIEHAHAKKKQEEDRIKKEAEDLAEKLNKTSCTVTVEVNDLEKLYGSVTDADIVKALEVEGLAIDKKMLLLEKPIEELGIFEVGVRLHPEVTARVRVWVAKK